jgi:hypothetical protein
MYQPAHYINIRKLNFNQLICFVKIRQSVTVCGLHLRNNANEKCAIALKETET